MKGYYFLDLFAGEAGVSRALDREGFQCFAYDVLYGPDGDLSETHVQNRIKSCIFSGKVLGVLIAPVCSSFSTAMNRVVVLRTMKYPWGVPGLPEHLQEKVRVGNRLMKFALQVVKWCLQLGVAFLVENPRSSWLFRLPPVLRLISAGRATIVVLDQCMYGRKWRKTTGLLAGNLEEVDLSRISRRCGCKLCRRTGKAHWVLEGRNQDGRSWTSIAQAFPPALCRAIAAVFAAKARALLLTQKTNWEFRIGQ